MAQQDHFDCLTLVVFSCWGSRHAASPQLSSKWLESRPPLSCTIASVDDPGRICHPTCCVTEAGASRTLTVPSNWPHATPFAALGHLGGGRQARVQPQGTRSACT